jgi:hypothetical protein
MSRSRTLSAAILATGLLFDSWVIAAAGYKELKRQCLAQLGGDFGQLAGWAMEGKCQVVEEAGQRVLQAEKGADLSLPQGLPGSYAVVAWVKLSAQPGERGKAEVTCGSGAKGRYTLEIQPAGSVLHIRTLLDGQNLWGSSTYKYREGGGLNSLAYQLKFDRKGLEQKLEAMKSALKGRTDEWQEWGLGIRGEFVEEREIRGIQQLIEQNDAQPLAHERWTQLAMDVCPDNVRMWVDGRCVADVREPLPASGGLSVRLGDGVKLRSLVVLSQPEGLGEFLPLDLSGHYNQALGDGARLLKGLVQVKGIPFQLSENLDGKNCIDVGQSAPMETGFAKGFMDSPFGSASGFIRHPSRIVLTVPKGWYSHLYVLALSEREPDTGPVVSFRFFRGEHTGTNIDYSCQVPYRDENPKGSVVSSMLLKGDGGSDARLHVVEVPLNPGLTQSYLEKSYFRDFQVEITKRLSFTRGYPDPWNYVSVPAGKRSSVRIAGLTFRTSPLQMVVTTDEVGNIIVEPERPHLNILLRNTSRNDLEMTLKVRLEDSSGNLTDIQEQAEVPEACSATKRLRLGLEKYGFYRLRVSAESGSIRLVKETTLGYLPADTRRATWQDSAFGVWGWGAGVGGYAYPTDSEETMRLIWKLGGRWTLNPADPKIAEKYGITNAWSFLPGKVDFQKTPKEKWEEEMKKAMLDGLKTSREQYRHQDLFLVFGEANLGMKQTYALPGRYYGEPDYVLNEKEKERFDRFFEQAALFGKVLGQVKTEYPQYRDVKLTFGNTSPSFHIEFLRKGFPKESIDVFGIDIPYFERMPERQPRAVEASQLLYLYEARKELGCENIPVCGTEDMYYPACPGSLTQREQADHYVRCHLLKFALGVTREASVGMVFTTAGPYGQGHYGATGFFEVSPEGGGDGNPRESAVAYATMTRVLDAAQFRKHFRTGSLSTFCLGFGRKYARDEVLALWTIHGRRPVYVLMAADLSAQVTDQWGNTSTVTTKDKILAVEVSSSPVYVAGIRLPQVKEVRAGEPTYASKPFQGYALLEDFDAPWQAVGERDIGYEENCFDLPKFKGEMTGSLVTSFDGGGAFQVALQAPAKERRLAPWYTAFVPPKPAVLPGRPAKIGVTVKGNSGWGRIIPQVTDAQGEIWTFIGPKDAWNADDIRSQSSVNFDGWKYMEMELPNSLPNGWPGPALAFWKNEKGDRVVDYPLSLTQVYVEQYTHNYYVNEVVPVPETVLVMDKFVCTYDDPYAEWHLTKGW